MNSGKVLGIDRSVSLREKGKWAAGSGEMIRVSGVSVG